MLTFDKAEIKGLMHCDLRCENLFFNENSIKIVDWKYGLIGYPMGDAMRFLVQNLRIVDRKQHYSELLKQYISAFEKASSLNVSE
jgi:thiamine kinase-like enzyme